MGGMPIMFQSSCFDADLARRLEALSLSTRSLFRGSSLGRRRSLQAGGGLEFSDHREYSGSDDFRYLDWNLLARADRLLVKRFQEDQDLPVYLMLDCSRSMGVGEPRKFDYGRKLVAALAYVALADLDLVSVLAFSGEVGAESQPGRGKEGFPGMVRFLDRLDLASTATDLARAAATFTSRPRRRGLVLVVSDWFDRAGFRRGIDLLSQQGHEVHAIQIYDPTEADPGLLGDLELIEIERGDRRKVTVTESVLRRYRELFREHGEGLRAYCLHLGFRCTRADTSTPLDDLIFRMLREAGTIR